MKKNLRYEYLVKTLTCNKFILLLRFNVYNPTHSPYASYKIPKMITISIGQIK